MKDHINTVGTLSIIYGIMGLVAGLVSLTFLVGIGFLASMDSQDENVLYIVGLLAMIFVGIILVSSIPYIIAGVYLKKRENWARILTLVLSVINLFAFPFGTALAIYSLWACTKQEYVKEFVMPGTKPSTQTA